MAHEPLCLHMLFCRVQHVTILELSSLKSYHNLEQGHDGRLRICSVTSAAAANNICRMKRVIGSSGSNAMRLTHAR